MTRHRGCIAVSVSGSEKKPAILTDLYVNVDGHETFGILLTHHAKSLADDKVVGVLVCSKLLSYPWMVLYGVVADHGK